MTLRTQQVLLVILALSAALVGGWATADPQSFYAIPHLIYHASHLQMYDLGDKIGNIVTLGGTALIAAALLAVPYLKGN
jgi:hypothetical protein